MTVELSAAWEGQPLWKMPDLERISEAIIRFELGQPQPPAESATLPTPSPSPSPSPAPSPLPVVATPEPLPEPTPTPRPAPDFSGELYTRRTELEPDIPALLSEPLRQSLSIE